MLRFLTVMNKTRKLTGFVRIFLVVFIGFLWWRDVHRESSNRGEHSLDVANGLKIGIVLFISSEVLFFASFFWCFFHSSISPNFEIGLVWPPKEIATFNPIRIPLLNTILLLSSGVSITWSHHCMLSIKYLESELALTVTILIGIVFSIFQGFEYQEAPFSMADSIYGSTFFLLTGFHGFHVLIGTIFLIVSLFRFNKINNSKNHTVGFECAAWYWHFVDVVWLFLYSMIYWWGN